ncbi:hypothetical protein BGZ94_006467 [Podila epigama]|nr:hypothetical protein BGZ94_006467 [Podila epigama]
MSNAQSEIQSQNPWPRQRKSAMSQHPLLLPEILTIIANSFPEWRAKVIRDGDRFNFLHATDVTTLFSCLRVCKLWYAIFAPMLYETVFGGLTIHPPSSTMTKHGSQVRVLGLDDNASLAHVGFDREWTTLRDVKGLQLPNVRKLYLDQGSKVEKKLLNDLFTSCGINREKLQFLYWKVHHYHQTTMDETTLTTLLSAKRLQELGLICWNLGQDQSIRILRKIENTLTTLTLSRIDGFHSLPADLTLPRLKTLNLHFAWAQSDALAVLPRACPALEKLQLDVDTTFDGAAMAAAIEHYSTLVQSPLVLESVLLGVLSLSTRMTESLITHAHTLKRLSLNSKVNDMDSALAAQILAACGKLEHVELTWQGRQPEAFIEPLIAQPWACTGLRSLRLAGFRSSIKGRKPRRPPRLAEIAATFSGWRLDLSLFDSSLRALPDVDIKRKLFGHIASYPMLGKVTLNDEVYYRVQV